jgi:hypothetical protein
MNLGKDDVEHEGGVVGQEVNGAEPGMESVSGMEPLSSTGFIGWGIADEGCGALKLKRKGWEVEGVEVEGVGLNVKRSAACWCG